MPKRDYNYHTLTDEELFQMLGESKAIRDHAFAELYGRFAGRIYAYCYKKANSVIVAEDIFQEIFIQFIQIGERKLPVQNVTSYIFKIARNTCLQYIQVQKEITSIEFDDNNNLHLSTETPLDMHEMQQAITAGLELLNENQRDAVTLQLYSGLSYQEIAEVKEVPVSTVRNWVVRAKKNLRRFLAPYMEL